jgi:regulation of enolase protein 1 (concanavalin A-like superfamily)
VVHHGDRTSERYLAYHGAGLLLWDNERDYVRLERAAIVRDEQGLHYSNFDIRQEGRHEALNAQIPDQDTYVRVERRGNQLLGATSQDGIHWQYFDAVPIEWPRKIKLGVTAINTSTEVFKAGFSELEVYKKDTNGAGAPGPK